MIEDLNALLEAAKELPDMPADGEFTKIPDGEYDAVIVKVEFKESKKKNLMFVWEFIISEGEFKKYHEWKYTVLNRPENMKRLVTDFQKFGINCEKGIAHIETQLDNLIDVPVKLTIKTTENENKPEEPYRNISVSPCNL